MERGTLPHGTSRPVDGRLTLLLAASTRLSTTLPGGEGDRVCDSVGERADGRPGRSVACGRESALSGACVGLHEHELFVSIYLPTSPGGCPLHAGRTLSGLARPTPACASAPPAGFCTHCALHLFHSAPGSPPQGSETPLHSSHPEVGTTSTPPNAPRKEPGPPLSQGDAAQGHPARTPHQPVWLHGRCSPSRCQGQCPRTESRLSCKQVSPPGRG